MQSTSHKMGTWITFISESSSSLQTVSPTKDLPDLAQNLQSQAIFDGYLFNQDTLQSEMGVSGLSEAQVLLRAYEYYGNDFISKLKGIYSFGLWDKHKKILLCARDRLGHFPLFYTQVEDTFFFSTTTQGLLSDSRISPKVNRLSLAIQLSHRWIDNTQTFYQTITRLPAGHFLMYSKTQISVHRYWDPIPKNGKIDWLGQEAFEEFSSLFESTIKNHLSLGRPGVFLSGGLDSVSVAAVATDLCDAASKRLPLALSLGFEAQGVNEATVQKSVAQQLGLKQIFLPMSEAVNHQGILQSTLNQSATLSAPVQNPWLGGYYSLGLLGKSQGCDFILTGGGGDEWLTVDPYYSHDLFKALNFQGLVHLLQSAANSYQLPYASVVRSVLWSNGLKKIFTRSLLRGVNRFPLTRNLVRNQYFHSSLGQIPKWIAPEPNLREEIEVNLKKFIDRRLEPKYASLYLETMDRGLNHPLLSMDMDEEFHRGKHMGLPMVSAFWNADLIEFLYRVPPDLLNHGKKSKGLVRHTLAKRFPNLHFEKQKKLVSINFFQHLLLTEGKEILKRIKTLSALFDLGIVHPSQTTQLIETIVTSNDARQAHRLWDLLSLEVWLRAQREV